MKTAGAAVQNYIIPKPEKKWLPITNTHHGLYLHKDHNNWSFGVILIFGCDINIFGQIYVTYVLHLLYWGWSLVFGNYRHLLHAVSSGTAGLRFSLVVSNHGSAVQGVDGYEKGCCFEIKICITHVFVFNSKKRIDQLNMRVIDRIYVLLL